MQGTTCAWPSLRANLLPPCSKHRACRLAFLPFFAWCAWGAAPPAAVFLLTAALGATNGSLTTTAFMLAAEQGGPAAAEPVGALMVFALMAGLLCGSLFAWLWLL